jgi:hypothetical protein
MIFISKRNVNQQRSSKQVFLSFLGLILAIGIIGGAIGLVYGKIKHQIFYIISFCLGLIKGNFLGTITGGIILGTSVILCIIFILMIYMLS